MKKEIKDLREGFSESIRIHKKLYQIEQKQMNLIKAEVGTLYWMLVITIILQFIIIMRFIM